MKRGRLFRLRQLVLAPLLVIALVLGLPGLAFANTYDSGSYGGGNYGVGQTSTTSSTSSTNSTSSTSSSSSTQSSSSSSSSTNSSGVIDLNKYGTTEAGAYTIDSASTDSVYSFSLTLSNGTTETHTLTVNNVFADSVEVILKSTPQNITLTLGQEKTVDLNGDGVNDVGVVASSITPPTAVIKIWKLNPGFSNTTASSTATASKSRNYSWLYIGLVILAVLLVVWAIINRIRKNKGPRNPLPPTPSNTDPTGGGQSSQGSSDGGIGYVPPTVIEAPANNFILDAKPPAQEQTEYKQPAPDISAPTYPQTSPDIQHLSATSIHSRQDVTPLSNVAEPIQD